MENKLKKSLWSALLGLALVSIALPIGAAAQDDQDDPPSRVARLGYMEGSVSFQPAGETDWVEAVENRPMTTGDQLWADKDSRAELQLGSAVIRLSANTGVSFLNLDDHTVQLQLSSGAVNIRVRRLGRDDDFEIDTPNLAFTISQPGSYRLEASEDGSNTIVTIRAGEGDATGNGQTYSLHAGQSGTFSGTDSLNADVEQIGEPDQFDTWADGRDRRYDDSRSAQYMSRDVVGYEDLDDNGDWRDDSNYGHVWFPSHVDSGWAPYHEGHWDWIDPWGYTWVDDSSWGYAPFHYGRWVSVDGRWGWIAGPPAQEPVYAPALVVFVGGGGGFGGNVGWFPLGPREVFVPSYPVSRTYMTQINVSSTTVNTTTVTNVYNTTVVNKTTNITNVTYVNRTVPGAVTAVPQAAFAGAQPVARAAVKLTPQQVASAPVSARVAVNPTRESVLGAKASTANHVTAPPAAVRSRQVVAKKTPPPPPPSFAARQQAMASHPGQPLPRRELASMHPAGAPAAHPAVKVAPPGKPATPTSGHPANAAARPGQPAAGAPANHPANRPGNQPAPNARPAAPAQPNRPATQPANRPEPNQPNNRPEPNRPPEANRPAPNKPEAQPNRPETNRPPAAQPNNRPAQPEPNRPPAAQPNNRPEPNRPPAAQPNNRSEPNRPPAAQPNNRPEPNRPPAAQPNNRPEPNRPPAAQPSKPEPARPEANRPPAAQPSKPEPARPEANRPAPKPTEPAARPSTPPPSAHPQTHTPPPAAAKPAPPPKKEPAKPQTPEEKKRQEEKKPPGV